MNKINWKTVAELVGVTAVVVSLVFVGLELRQSRLIAQAQVNAALLSASVDVSDAINRNIGIWSRGAAGQELSSEEELIFLNLVIDLNDRMITEYYNLQLLDAQREAEIVLYDFAIRLSENPGARRVWLEREQSLNEHRQLLDPRYDFYSFWQAGVTEALRVLDASAQ